jgi:hypothetical protein
VFGDERARKEQSVKMGKFKIWNRDADEQTAIEVEAHSTFDAVNKHAGSTWRPEMGEEMHLIARDEEGLLREVDIYIDFEPNFDIWIQRADGKALIQ